MDTVILTKPEARKIILHAAGLSGPAPFGKGPEAVRKAIEHLGFVQLDTNYTVERAHHHLLATRVPDYEITWLGDLLAEGQIYEYYTSDAGYMPMRDFRFSLPAKESFASDRDSLTAAERNLMNKILDRIGREGPLTMKDFENDRQEAGSGWWDWRPAKIALERLCRDGRLMISRTGNFQKVYDLAGNMIPDDIDTSMPTAAAFARHAILRDLKAMGIAQVKELAWRSRHVKNNLVKAELEKMIAEGRVCRVAVESLPKASLYMLPAYKDSGIMLSDNVFILSPFDIVNVFRHRLKDFFDFDYQIECFVPEAKRKYGYFSLPILAGDRFIARMDSKADRKRKNLVVHNLHFEPLPLTETILNKLVHALTAFARFNRCRSITFTKSNQKKYLEAIESGVLKAGIAPAR